MLDQPGNSSDELPMTVDEDVSRIVTRNLGQHRIGAAEQMIERLSARPISEPAVSFLPVALRMRLSVCLGGASEAVWAQVREFFDRPQFEWNLRKALCSWLCRCDGALEGG